MNSNGQPISFPIDALLDQSANPAIAAPGTLVTLVNLEKLAEAGALTKRHGYRAVDDTNWTQSGTVRAFAHGDQVLRIDRDSVWSYMAGAGRAVLRDRAPKWSLSKRRHIAGDGVTSALFGGATSTNGFRLWVWQQANGSTQEVWALIIDETTDAVIRGPELISTAATTAELPRCIAIDGSFFILWMESASTRIRYRGLAATASAVQTGSWAAAASLVTDLETSANKPSFDITLANTTLTPRLALAYNYNNGAGTRGLKCAIFGSTLASLLFTYSTTTASQCPTIASGLGDTVIWLADGANGTTVNLNALDQSAALLASGTYSTAAANYLTIGLCRMSATKCCAIGSTTGTNTGDLYWNTFTYAAGSISAGSATTQKLTNVVLSSKPFFDGREAFAWVEAGPDGTAFSTYQPYNATMLLQLTHDGGSVYSSANGTAPPQLIVAYGRTVFGMYAGLSGGTITVDRVAPQAPAASGNFWYWSPSLRPRPPQSNFSAREVQEYAIRLTEAYDTAALVADAAGRVVVCSGACQPMQWDGQLFTELGFVHPPYATNSTSSSGGSIAAGTYQYALTYEHTDAAGQRHQSAPFIIATTVTHASGSANKVDWTINTLRIQSKQDPEFNGKNVDVVLWRTKAGPDGIFRRVAAVANDTSVATVSIADTYSDTTIGSNEPLYYSQGELEHAPPPPSRHVIAYENRLAGIDAEFPNRIWFSKKLKFDEGHAYSAALEQYVSEAGDLVALGTQDGTLYAFSTTAIAVAAYGDGQDNTGGGTWPASQVIVRGIGCQDARAIVTCPDGILFASGVGGRTRLWLLPRGAQSPIEVGTKVRSELDLYATVTSMCHAAPQARVYITVMLGSSGANEVLVYDYGNRGPDGLGVWYVWSVAMAAASIRGAVFAAGAHWLCGTSLWQQSSSRYDDLSSFGGSNAWVTYEVRTHDIRPGGFSPFGKLNGVVAAYEYADQGQVEISFTTDQGATYSTRFASAITSGTAGAPLVRQFEPDLKRLYSGVGISVRFRDASPDGGTTTNSASVLPRGLTLDYLPLGGTVRPQSTERMAQ